MIARILSKVVIASLAIGCMLQTFAEIGSIRKKVIYSGWDTVFTTLESIVTNVDQFAKLPIDGLDLRVFYPNNVFVPQSWSKAEFESKIPLLRQIVARPTLRHSFLTVNLLPKWHVRLDDDAAWERLSNNLRVAAWLAHEGGLKGLTIDNEDYRPHTIPFNLFDEDGMAYEDAYRLARERGRQAFAGVFEEFPDAEVFFFWLLSREVDYLHTRDALGAARTKGDLWVPFVNGILDVCPLQARLIDGNESAYRYTGDRFRLEAHNVYNGMLSFVEPENRAKYRMVVDASFGLYLDMFTNPAKKPDGSSNYWYFAPQHGSRLNHFADNLEKALEAANEFVWIYGEKHSAIAWKGTQQVYPKLSCTPFTNVTWEAALPGFWEKVAIAKDPNGVLGAKLERLLASSSASNCITVAAQPTYGAEKGRMTAYAKNVKLGSWYAIVSEMKGAGCYTDIFRAKGGEVDWSKPTVRTTFGKPGADGWRRGTSFVFIEDGIDELQIAYGLRMEPRHGAANCRLLKAYRLD